MDSYRIEFRASVLFSVEADSPEEAKAKAVEIFNAHNSGELGDNGWDIDVDDRHTHYGDSPAGRVYLNDDNDNDPEIVDRIEDVEEDENELVEAEQ